MPIFRAQNKVPEVYVNESRDFQLLCRALDITQNANKYDIDTITDVLNTDICDNTLLPLQQLKLGFHSNSLIDDDDLRHILKAFPYIKSYKDSKDGIRLAVNTYLKLRPNKLDSIRVINKVIKNGVKQNVYKIIITFVEQANDLFLLDEMLKFIIPPGYFVEYTYAKYSDRREFTSLELHDVVLYSKTTQAVWTGIDSSLPISDNATIRDLYISEDEIIDRDYSNTNYLNNVKQLDKNGLISRISSSINVGEIKYSRVNMQGE